MLDEDKPGPKEPTGESDKGSEHAHRIARYAMYTAPVMLAMLTSQGQKVAAQPGTFL